MIRKDLAEIVQAIADALKTVRTEINSATVDGALSRLAILGARLSEPNFWDKGRAVPKFRAGGKSSEKPKE